MRYSRMKRLLSLMMAVVMVMSLGVNGAYAVESDTETTFTYERMDPSDVTADLVRPGISIKNEENSATLYESTDKVRVIIVMEASPAISMFSARDAISADSADVALYRNELEAQQNMVANYISEEALNGKDLQILQNLTLVANAFSAVVEYGQIEAIRQTEGVAAVYVEPSYQPMKTVTNNITAQEMTGASVAQYNGYTGAGTRIAIIDTGTDTDHQSFSGAALEYAYSKLAEEKGMSYDEYVATLDLLTLDEIESVLTQLHAYKNSNGKLTAKDLYLNTKLPFNYNYIDRSLDVTHDNDDKSSHGSHVAGIAAANRYIDCSKVYDFDGNGTFDINDVQAVMDFIVTGTGIQNPDYADVSDDGTITSYDVRLIMDALSGHMEGAHFITAADSVLVTGSAPDAQIITMKVFGASADGCYASDYMAAVEDAILLGCDVVNLSLGTTAPGFTLPHYTEADGIGLNEFINDVMDRVAKSDIVMSVSNGNSYNWVVNDQNVGMTHTDEGGNATTSEPAAYDNTLAVASVENTGSVSSIQFVFKGENSLNDLRLLPITTGNAAAGIDPWVTLDPADPARKGTTYELVFLGDPTFLLTGEGTADDRIYANDLSDFEDYDFTNKIVLIARGNGIPFSVKHSNAGLADAAAVLLYNNVPGVFGADLTGTTSLIPCGTLAMEEAQDLYAMFTQNDDGLYAGTLTIYNRQNIDPTSDAMYPTMSDFSSWGATGKLTMKPEITAPGGNIYSVNGVDRSGAAYETMSGTSMSAPHLSGLAALMSQYYEETGLLAKTGLTARQMSHSLLMSTATPLIEKSTGLEYSVRNQGAGLANVENAMLSNAFITVAGQSDGKVKAELGDGTADRTVKFTITNFGENDLTYTLDASILTTKTVKVDGRYYSDDSMAKLDADVSFSAKTVTVPAGKSVTVTAVISVPASTVAEMAALGYTNGFYLEGFIYINPVADGENVVDATHSIPLLGWYGNWNDPSMYDKGSFIDYITDAENHGIGHIDAILKNMLAFMPVGYGEGLPYVGNIYSSIESKETETGETIFSLVGDQRYIEARNAISSNEDAWWEIYAILPTLIRNVGDLKLEIRDVNTGELYLHDDFEDLDDILYTSYYYPGYGWVNSAESYSIGPDSWKVTDMNDKPLADGTVFDIVLSCVPEYYVDKNGGVDWETCTGKGTELSYRFTVDNTYPDLAEGAALSYNKDTKKLTFTVQDDRYIAAVVLLNGSASTVYDYYYPDMDENKIGTAVTGSFDLSKYSGKKFAIAICDYAGNETTYAINIGGEGASYGQFLGFQLDPNGAPGTWVAFDTNVKRNETAIFTNTESFICAEFVGLGNDGLIFAQDEKGKLYGIPYADMLANTVDLEACYIGLLDNRYQDLAYNYKDGQLYGLTALEDDKGMETAVYVINIKNDGYVFQSPYAEPEELDLYEEAIYFANSNFLGLTLAIDDAGQFYILANSYEKYKNAVLLVHEPVVSDRFGESGVFLRGYADTGMKMDYRQSMTWDHNTETLYWARFYPESIVSLKHDLIKIDTTNLVGNYGNTKASCTVMGQLSEGICALIAPLTDSTHDHATFDTSVPAVPEMVTERLSLNVGNSSLLTCTFTPWYSADTELYWESDDTSVATVDQNGLVTAVGKGTATITAYLKSKYGTAEQNEYMTKSTVNVVSLNLSINGIISYTAGGIGSWSKSKLYDFNMVEGISDLEMGTLITAPTQFQGYGLSIASAVEAKGYIWACEGGNLGMIYKIDPKTGVIVDMLSPIDGDMMFGMSYSEATGNFTTIANYWLFVDQPFTHEVEEDMKDSYDDKNFRFTWHRFDMSEYLKASDKGFQTGEAGFGSMNDVVFAGITTIDNTKETAYTLTKDFLGNGISNANTYTPTTTHVLLDNVGRLWYIDEIVGMKKDSANEFYTYNTDSDTETMWVGIENNGVFAQEYKDGTYNVFVIRQLAETALTEMYYNDTMPRITYHFSDIHYVGEYKGAPMFMMSLYDYWNEGAENLLYLYVAPSGRNKEILISLGGTGTGNIIATITGAEYIGGLD